MKKIILLLVTVLLLSPLFAIGKINKDCIFRGKKLGGRVKVVTNGTEDFKVQIVENGMEDINVQIYPYYRTGCGEWSYVTMDKNNGTEDFKIKFVTNGTEDFRIKIVTTNNTGVR